MKKTDLGIVAFMYGICLMFFVMTGKLIAAARIYPLVIIALLFFLTTLYFIRMVREAKIHGITSGLEEFEGFLPRQFFTVLGMIAAYLAVMYIGGFYLSTILFMAASLLFLKVKKRQILIAIGVVLVLVYSAFTIFLGVKLPAGILF